MTLVLHCGKWFNVKEYTLECKDCEEKYEVTPEKESKFGDEVHCRCGRTLIHSQKELKEYGELEIK